MSASRRKSGPARHRRHAPSRTRQGAAIAVTGVVSASMVMGAAAPAGAAEKPVSQARGFFLSGSALGVNLDTLVELQGARAKNFGTPDTVSQLNPLGVTLLNSLHLPLTPINVLEGNDLLKLGALNQAAIARSSGSAIGASGAVTDSGAIAINGQNNVPAANAKLDLGGALDAGVLGALADVDLNVGALAASAKQATGKNGKQTGAYRIAQLKLTLQSPLLAGILGTVAPQLAGLQEQVDGVIGGLGLLGGVVTVSNLPSLALDTTLGGGSNGVSINLTTGRITVDVEKLLISLGLDLNNLPPNTELIDKILNALDTGVVKLVTDELNALAARITAAVAAVTVTITIPVVGTTIPLTPAQLTAVTGALNTLLPTLLAPLQGTKNTLTGQASLLDPVFDALDGLVSLVVNAQSRSNGEFTERALVVRVLPGADELVRLNLASASVGPGAGPNDDNGDDDGDNPSLELPHTGSAGVLGLGAAGLALVVAGAAAAGAGRASRGRHARS